MPISLPLDFALMTTVCVSFLIITSVLTGVPINEFDLSGSAVNVKSGLVTSAILILAVVKAIVIYSTPS